MKSQLLKTFCHSDKAITMASELSVSCIGQHASSHTFWYNKTSGSPSKFCLRKGPVQVLSCQNLHDRGSLASAKVPKVWGHSIKELNFTDMPF